MFQSLEIKAFCIEKLIFVFSVHMHGEGYLSWTGLAAVVTRVFQGHVFGLDVMPHVPSVLGRIVTRRTLPETIQTPYHALIHKVLHV